MTSRQRSLGLLWAKGSLDYFLKRFGDETGLFSPTFDQGARLLGLSCVCAVIFFWLFNLAVVSIAEWRLGASDLQLHLEEDAEDGRAFPEDWKDSPWQLASAWGLFDPGGGLTSCETTGKPLAELLEKLECVERANKQGISYEGLNVDAKCHFSHFSAGKPRSDNGETRDWLGVRNALVANILGVGSGSLITLFVRPYADNLPLGGILRSGDYPSATNGKFERGLVYWFYFDAVTPEALLMDPDCKSIKDALDGFSVKVTGAIRAAQARVFVERWLVRSINGPIQFLMLALSIWSALRLVQRKRNQEELEQDSTFWEAEVRGYQGIRDAESSLISALKNSHQTTERWLIDIIPMLGFLGTVVGMISAMELVGEVVSADPGSELNSAMGDITSALSVAFFTTFIGIVAASIIGLFQERRSASEIRTIRRQVRAVRARLGSRSGDGSASVETVAPA